LFGKDVQEQKGRASVTNNYEDIYYKAKWINAYENSPLPSNETIRMMSLGSKLFITSNDERKIDVWTLDQLGCEEFKFKCQNFPITSEMKRSYHGACAIGNKVLIFGGQGSNIRYHPDYIKRDILILDLGKID
jgi:hypothetical protein